MARNWLLFCLPVVACKSAAAKQQEQLEQSISWLATVQEVGRAWSENRVPANYTERTLREAERQLRQAGQAEAARRVVDVAEILRRRDRERLPAALGILDAPRDQLQQRLQAMKGPP